MAGLSLILMSLPFLVTMVSVAIGLLMFLAVCLLIMGISGIAMNRIYMRQTLAYQGTIKKFYTSGPIILGVISALVPAGYALYMILSTLFGGNPGT